MGKPRLQITARFAREANQGDIRRPPYGSKSSDDKQQDKPYRDRYQRFCRHDGANLSEDDFYDGPVEHADEYGAELEADGYQAAEEIYVDEAKDDTTKDDNQQDTGVE